MFRPAEAQPRDESPGEPLPTLDAPRRPRRLRAWLIAAGGLLLIIIILVGVKVGQIATMIKVGKTMLPPPESVTAAQVKAEQWRPVRSAVGTLVALRGVTLGAELTGTVREIAFENGATVKKGQLLVRLDTSAEDAQLQGALADEALSKQTLERARRLRKDLVNTEVDLQTAQARALQATANGVNLRALIAKKVIRAPFDGRVGIRQVELGQVVSSGTPIVSLQSVTPIYAEFQLPQQALADVKVGQKVTMTVDVFPGASWDGTVTTINPEVDPVSRNVRMRATVENKDGRLAPGMFASVEVFSDKVEPVVTVPATSVLFAPYGDSVYVLEEKKGTDGKSGLTARQTFVRVGEHRGDFVAVASGLKAGETVVSNGAFKVRNGQQVQVKNDTAPAQLAPAPADR
jgi:membrane fusion protein (multidrug efflux system)